MLSRSILGRLDKVPHSRLVCQVTLYGIQVKLTNWMQNWLKGSSQKEVINGSFSTGDLQEVVYHSERCWIFLLFIIYCSIFYVNVAGMA